MTLPIFLAVHLVYGALMARVLLRRMRAEGEVLGLPFVATLVPVALASMPLAAVLLRYAGAWFLHGFFFDDKGITYERFHLGLMLGTGLLAGVFTVMGMFWILAMLTRERSKLAQVPTVCAGLIVIVTLALDGKDVIVVHGVTDRWFFMHPAGVVSLAVVAFLIAALSYAKARIATVMPRPVGTPQSIDAGL